MCLLERIADVTKELEGGLAELQALEIIYYQGLLSELTYVFKHGVIQEVAYNSLLMRQRRELHRAVGAAIEDLYPDRLSEHFEKLAYHFTQREVWEKALAYSVLAGDRSAETIAANLTTPHLHQSFLTAAPVLDIYAALGRQPPPRR